MRWVLYFHGLGSSYFRARKTKESGKEVRVESKKKG